MLATTRMFQAQETIMMIRRGLLARLSGALPAVIVVVGVCLSFQIGGIRVNASTSLPLGLYKITTDPSAKLVEFCPAEPFASLSAIRGYRGKGNCLDGAEPLMKPIVAVEGDTVEISIRGVTVNGKLLPNSSPRSFDKQNRSLAHWSFGTYNVGVGTVWVISSFNSRSFDSRYFGPIPASSIRSRLQALITE
jgi:conjugative transfer signal peptidase TraF